MDLVHLHLMLNHVPVIGIVFGLFVLLGGVLTRSKPVAIAGLGLLIFAGLIAIPVYFTGEPAEEMVEGLPGVSEAVIGTHESAAMVSLVLAMATGLLAMGTVVLLRTRLVRAQSYLVMASLLVSMITGISMIQTANLGGQIRHSEIRAASQPTSSGGERKRTDTRETDDDKD